MFDALVGALAALGEWSDPLAWAVLATFVGGALLDRYDREAARYLTVAAWGIFAVLWLSLVHYYVFEFKSIVEGVGSVLAVPACLYAGFLLARGRDSLFVLSRAVAVMALVFLPFEAVPLLRRTLIEAVTDQTALLMALAGHEPTVVGGMTVEGFRIEEKIYPYESTFVFYRGTHVITYTIRIACTGLGSIAIFAGTVLAVRAPARRKLRALAVSVPVIYGLNLVRNAFIGLSFGGQRLHVFPEFVLALFGSSDPYLVSYFVADRLVAQFLSVVALVGIAWLVVRELPEALAIVEDAVYVATGSEYDLRAALDRRPVRADGEGR